MAYVEAVEAGDDARALACAQQVVIRLGQAIPYEDDFNSAHILIMSLLFALHEVAAGRLDRHPILRGRYKVGGVGQLSAAQETTNGIGAGVMLFLMERGVSEHSAARLVSAPMGVSVTTAKNLIAARKRKLLKATATPILERIKSDFDSSGSTDAIQFARHWLRKQIEAMVTVSPP
jgi:hypothetical protein